MGDVIKGNFKSTNVLDDIRLDNGRLPDYVWPGGYPLFYVKNGTAICPECANKDEAGIEFYDANWEDPEMYCDECNKRISSAYAEDDDLEDEE